MGDLFFLDHVLRRELLLKALHDLGLQDVGLHEKAALVCLLLGRLGGGNGLGHHLLRLLLGHTWRQQGDRAEWVQAAIWVVYQLVAVLACYRNGNRARALRLVLYQFAYGHILL